MRKLGPFLAIAFIATIIAGGASAKDIPLQGKDAKVHRIVSDNPGPVQVTAQYSKAIKIKKLGKNDVAYWNPNSGKYITAGEYAYVWCKVMNTKSGSANFHWIAVNASAVNQALNMIPKFPSGVAFYRIFSEGKNIVMEAYPYETIHAIAEGKKVIPVKE